jgi:hypothetical protein
MVLKGLSLLLLAALGGCATAGYERYGVFDLKLDKIYQHRALFMDGGKVSMAYSIVYWAAIEGKVEKEKEEKIAEVYYVWLRNNTDASLPMDPKSLSLLTEKGERIPRSPLTERTTFPLKKTELGAHGIAEGYVVFEVPRESIDKDKPSQLVYEDQAGNRAIRYIQVDDMKRYEGLVLKEPVQYYAPIYPRKYWYPHYYPYAYYPYDLRLFFFYHYEPRGRYYYYVPAKPKKRKFYTPSRPKKREFKKGPSEPENEREFR